MTRPDLNAQSSEGCVCESRTCRACREWRIKIDRLVCSEIGLEVAGYADSLIEAWLPHGSATCSEQVQLHLESMYPEVDSLLLDLVLQSARDYISRVAS